MQREEGRSCPANLDFRYGFRNPEKLLHAYKAASRILLRGRSESRIRSSIQAIRWLWKPGEHGSGRIGDFLDGDR